MMKIKFLSYAALVALSAAFVSCKDKDGDEPSLDDQGSGTMEEYTPDESKRYIESTGKEFLNFFNPSDQQEAIELANYFVDEYGDLDAPDEFEIEEDEYDSYATPAALMRAIGILAKSGNPAPFSRAMYTTTYDFNFDRFTGIYEPGRRKWLRTGDSDDVVFRFTGPSGETCEARAKAEGKTSNFEFSYTDEYFWSDDTEEYIYKFAVPKILTATVKKGSKELVNAKVETDINYNGHSYTATINATVANIEVKVNTNGNDSKIYEASTVAVNNKVVLSTACELQGKNLCNVDKIIDEMEDDIDDENITKWFTSATAKVSVLDKIQAYADVTFSNRFFEIGDSWGYWDYSSMDEAFNKAERVADVFNNNIDAKLRYDNTTTDQAIIKFQPRLDEWGYGWEWYIEPVLYFPADDTTYFFDKYFESGFRSLTNQWESLVDSYKRLWK